MLGVVLYSYGFMQKAFPWLVGFIISQLALMAVASMPLDRWRSFRATGARRKDQPRDLQFVPPDLAVERPCLSDLWPLTSGFMLDRPEIHVIMLARIWRWSC